MGRIFMSTEITIRKTKQKKVFAQEKHGILVICFVEIILLFIQSENIIRLRRNIFH